MCILHFSLKKNRFIIYFARMCPTENQDFNRSEIILDLCAIYPMGYSPIISPIEDLSVHLSTCPMRLFFQTHTVYERLIKFRCIL